MKRQSLLLTSTLKTLNTTSGFQRYVQEVANGAIPHCRDALKLAFGNTVDGIKKERQRIVDERKAREAEEAREAERAREEEMSRPMLKCSQSQWYMCGVVSINGMVGSGCSNCGGYLWCTACNQEWGGGPTCGGCGKIFR